MKKGYIPCLLLVAIVVQYVLSAPTEGTPRYPDDIAAFYTTDATWSYSSTPNPSNQPTTIKYSTTGYSTTGYPTTTSSYQKTSSTVVSSKQPTPPVRTTTYYSIKDYSTTGYPKIPSTVKVRSSYPTPPIATDYRPMESNSLPLHPPVYKVPVPPSVIDV
ncbi:uncharacterized protein ACRADG_008754 [Cochliomyia hominivorax]